MKEQQYHLKLYSFFQKLVYVFVTLDCLIVLFAGSKIFILSELLIKLTNIPIFSSVISIKLSTIFLVVLVSIGTKAKKKLNINIISFIILPILIGLTAIVFSLLILKDVNYANIVNGSPEFNYYHYGYIALSFIGTLVFQIGSDNVSKIIKLKAGKDVWNTNEESFAQNKELIETDTSVNIPYNFRYKNKLRKGWLNVDPFRGNLVIGTPGSGKTFGILIPAMIQMIKKNFSLLIYDFKYPSLAETAYYHHLKKKKNDKNYKHKFSVVSLDSVENSVRVNPIDKKYMKTLAQAQNMSEAMVSALQKGTSTGGSGTGQFFAMSSINLLSCCLYFFSKYKDGKYSDIPHVLSFINLPYETLFEILFTEPELKSLLSPFQTAFKNKAFDQLEGQLGTLKIYLSRLATKESYWVFSGNDIDLKITDKKNPQHIVLASNPITQEINSSLLSSVLNQTLTVINSENNLPGALLADEFPTTFIHKVENTIATARSNRIAVWLGLQELPQLKQYYKKEVGDTIISIVGNIFAGSVREKQTVEWLERIFGKKKQMSISQTLSQDGSTSISEKMDALIPAGKIASQKTGEMVGIIAQNFEKGYGQYKSSAFNGKIKVDIKKHKKEEANYKPLPQYYSFVDKNNKDQKDKVLTANFNKIERDIEEMVFEFKQKLIA